MQEMNTFHSNHVFCTKEQGEQNATPGTNRPADLLGSGVPCDRAFLAKEDFPASSSRTCWQVSDTCLASLGDSEV